MKKIGIVPISGKPYHAGHDGLVRLAASENDEVHLYVSLSDRKRPGELPITGAAMEKIWKLQIEPSLPDNVIVTYGGSPIANTFDDIGEASEADSDDVYLIYSDPIDAEKNFSDKLLEKYAASLFLKGNVSTRPVQRTSTVNVSGTKMRSFMAKGDKKSFLKFMPKSIDGSFVWNTLLASKPSVKASKRKLKLKSIKGESLIREYVKQLMS